MAAYILMLRNAHPQCLQSQKLESQLNVLQPLFLTLLFLQKHPTINYSKRDVSVWKVMKKQKNCCKEWKQNGAVKQKLFMIL